MSRALLLAEAEPGTRAFLERHLASEGFEVLGADAEREALELAERARPDLVLIGALEDAAGAEVCRRLREGVPGRSWDRNVPVIVLGETQADAVDRVQAFERGCDDFVPRPFHYEELVARIHAVLRRTQPRLGERLAAGPVAIDRATRRVTVHGFPVALAAKEFELVAKLATDPTRVFTKEELLREVWGFVALGRTRTLDSHASRLRRKLALAGAEDCVLNVWGVGYRLLGEDEGLRQTA
jgi:DNA-binding response OmpR family regulator